jgi:hypothetical protein
MRERRSLKNEEKIARISAIQMSDWFGAILSTAVIALLLGR